MPFIGNKPSAVPLTSADIADGIIVNADISSTAGITLNKISGNPNFRNIVINGDMQIAQRNTSVASITTSGYYTLDRWHTTLVGLGTWTMSQSTDTPTGQGFASSLKLDCTTADASPAAGDIFFIQQKIEGQNLQYLKKGTANAVSLTASFWVKSTKTGTFIVEFYDYDNTRSISKSYTVNTTNTWEFKTVTFAGDTTGAFGNDNGQSANLIFWLGAGTNYTSGTLNTSWGSPVAANEAAGQVNIADSTANDFLITGVQLEAGTSATDFEFLPIDVSLERCQRYFYKLTNASGASGYLPNLVATRWTLNEAVVGIPCAVPLRATPSITKSGTMYIYTAGASTTLGSVSAVPTNYNTFSTTPNVRIAATGITSSTGYVVEFDINAYFEISAEL